MKKIFNIFLLFSLFLNNISTGIIAANHDIIEVENGIYMFAARTRTSNAVEQDDTLVNYEDTLYIHLYDGYYAEAIERQIDINNLNIDMAPLKKETQQVIRDLVNSKDEDYTITNLSVITLVNEKEAITSLANMRSSTLPVTNEQIRYTGYTNYIEIYEDDEAFERYAGELFSKIANQIGSDILSLNPVTNTIIKVASLFPSNYSNIKYYTDYQLFGKVIEEKVVQLSWVNVSGDIYLGAHTQFTTVQFRSMLSSYGHDEVIEDTGYIYFRTPNYQSPQNMARLNWGNTWIEKIESYKFKGVTFPSL